MKKIIYIFVALVLYSCTEEGIITESKFPVNQAKVLTSLSVESIASTYDTSRIAGVICLSKFINNYTLDTALNAEIIHSTSESAYAYFANETRNGLYAEPSISINGFKLLNDTDSLNYYTINRETGINDFHIYQGSQPNEIKKSMSELNSDFNFNVSFTNSVSFLNILPNQRVSSNSDLCLTWENSSHKSYYEIKISGMDYDADGTPVIKFHKSFIVEDDNTIIVPKDLLSKLINMNTRIEIIKYEPHVLQINNTLKDILVISCSSYNSSFVVN